MKRAFFTLVAAAVFAANPSLAQTTADAKEPPIKWEDVAKAEGLSDAEIGLLQKHKFVLGSHSFKQIFTPYVGNRVPVFITSDSLLNGFHVLFEESIYRMEEAQARKLPAILTEIGQKLNAAITQAKGDPQLIAAGAQRARIFLATARLLLDDKALPEDAAVRAAVVEEVRRVSEGQAKMKPAWLGPPDDGFLELDYSRFVPRGFYDRSPQLKRHFRAVSWLQAIPFRLDNDEEMAAFFLLRRSWRLEDGKRPEFAGFWTAYRRFLGAGDDWDISSAYWDAKAISRAGFAAARESYRADATRRNGPEINDQIRFLPDNNGKPEISFRFLSAYRIPDGVLFQRTMRDDERELPTGLEIAAALGSPFAREELSKKYPKVLAEIDRHRALFDASRKRFYPDEPSLYLEYLNCLKILLERTEPDAPKLFQSKAWKLKTCQTALAGWAQLRHTWALQAKPGARYLSASPRETGFVEPVPEFYARFATLVDKTQKILAESGALERKGWSIDFTAVMAVVNKARKDKKGIAALSPEDIEVLAQFDPRLSNELPAEDKARALKAALEGVELLDKLFGGKLEKGLSSKEQAALGYELGHDHNLEWAWTNLLEQCRRLEIIAHKQLRKVPFSNEEHDFIANYGRALAGIMLYGGNSYSTPRDDAPRIVDVFSNPAKGQHLHAGIGKPRIFWVLYPVEDREVLCMGAVLSYYEFAQRQRLTDAAWRSLLRSADAPQPPAWMGEIAVELKSANGGKK